MKCEDLLNALFPAGHEVEIEDSMVFGTADLNGEKVAVLGTTDTIYIGLREILELGDKLIKIMKDLPGLPILMLVDNNGQRMALEEELLALPQYIANLVEIQDMARRNGHKLVALVYGTTMAGGFIAWGMCADRTYAMEDAHTSVMNLKAMARVTHSELSMLEKLSQTVPIFAPGVENLHKVGGLHGIWTKENASQNLAAAIKEADSNDTRARLGKENCGRTMAYDIINMVENA